MLASMQDGGISRLPRPLVGISHALRDPPRRSGPVVLAVASLRVVNVLTERITNPSQGFRLCTIAVLQAR